MRTVYVLREGKLVAKETAPPKGGAFFMPDIQEFRSPVDGSVISSRAHLRHHNRAHGVEQVGNDPAFVPPDKRGEIFGD